MNLVPNTGIEFYRTHICVQTELLSVKNNLREPGQLRLRIRLARLGENRFAINLMANCAEQDRIGRFALFKRTFGPFGLVLGVVVAPTRNLLDLKIDLK